jgi:hypothetical protein
VDFLEGSGGGDKVVVFYYIGNLEETGVSGGKTPTCRKSLKFSKISYIGTSFRSFYTVFWGDCDCMVV